MVRTKLSRPGPSNQGLLGKGAVQSTKPCSFPEPARTLARVIGSKQGPDLAQQKKELVRVNRKKLSQGPARPGPMGTKEKYVSGQGSGPGPAPSNLMLELPEKLGYLSRMHHRRHRIDNLVTV